MLIGARTGAWTNSGVPLPYDERLAYIESNGKQWIDTGLVATPTNAFGAEVEFVPTVMSHGGTGTTNTVCITGANSTAGSGFELRWQGGGFGGSYGGYKYGTLDEDYLLGKDVLAKNIDGRIIFAADGDVVVDVVAEKSTRGFVTGSVLLFGIRRSSAAQSVTLMWAKLKSANYSIGGVMQKRFVPVLKDGVPCLYDELGGGFYYNMGSGAFGYGRKDGSHVDPV